MTNAQIWHFWLARVQTIEKLTMKFARSHGLDVDDFRQDLLIRLVENHPRYDEKRCAPATWAYWWARAVATDMTRSKSRRLDERFIDDEASATDARAVSIHDDSQSARALDAVVGIIWATKLATDDEIEAARVRLEGLSEREIRDRLGVAPFTVRRRLQRLRQRLEA